MTSVVVHLICLVIETRLKLANDWLHVLTPVGSAKTERWQKLNINHHMATVIYFWVSSSVQSCSSE